MDIFENFCRTCGNECNDAVNIFDDDAKVLINGSSVALLEILNKNLPAMSTMPPILQDDDYPKLVCSVCVEKLATIHKFCLQWENANREFNVALKFERRKRGRSQTSSAVSKTADQREKRLLLNSEATDIKVQNKKYTPVEYTVLSVGKSAAAKSKAEKVDSKDMVVYKINSNDSPETVVELVEVDKIKTEPLEDSPKGLYGCEFCDKWFHTLSAHTMHNLCFHRITST